MSANQGGKSAKEDHLSEDENKDCSHGGADADRTRENRTSSPAEGADPWSVVLSTLKQLQEGQKMLGEAVGGLDSKFSALDTKVCALGSSTAATPRGKAGKQPTAEELMNESFDRLTKRKFFGDLNSEFPIHTYKILGLIGTRKSPIKWQNIRDNVDAAFSALREAFPDLEEKDKMGITKMCKIAMKKVNRAWTANREHEARRATQEMDQSEDAQETDGGDAFDEVLVGDDDEDDDDEEERNAKRRSDSHAYPHGHLKKKTKKSTHDAGN